MNALWTVLREALSQFFADKCPRLAAALAYYTLLSLAPFLYLVVLLTSIAFGTEAARAELAGRVEASIGPEAASLVSEALAAMGETNPGVWGAVLGMVLLLVAGTTVFGELQGALNQVWGLQAPAGKPFLRILRERFLSLGLVLLIGLLLVASMLANAVVAALAGATPQGTPYQLAFAAIDLTISIGVLTLLIAAMYKVLPDASIRWRDVWSGAALTALLLAVGKILIGAYVGAWAPGSAYGAAGALALLLAWVYFAGLIFFLGAELTEIRAARRGHVVPRRGAVRVEPRRVPLQTPRHPDRLEVQAPDDPPGTP